MSRIKGNMSLAEIVAEMSDGNPGAINVMMGLMKTSEDVDPDNVMGGLMVLLNLDSFEIYGSHIWILYKELCGEDIVATHAVIRAVQLNLLNISEVKGSIASYKKLDVRTILEMVQKILPKFATGEFQLQPL